VNAVAIADFADTREAPCRLVINSRSSHRVALRAHRTHTGSRPALASGGTRVKGVVTRAVVADDRTLIADGIALLLRSVARVEVSQVVSNLKQLPAAIATHKPDILVLGIETIAAGQANRRDADVIVAELRSAGFDVPVLCLMPDDQPERIARYLEAGISGLLTTAATPAELGRAVQDILAGRAGLAPAQVADVIGHLTGTRPKRRPAKVDRDGLTRREREVLVRLTAGASTEEIALDLDISKHTVRTHVQNLLAKLGVHSKLEASAYAVRHGLVPPTR
jgi:DNA-binding NarL/FixJ family response regulator